MSRSLPLERKTRSSHATKKKVNSEVQHLKPTPPAMDPEVIAGTAMKAVQFYSPYGYRLKIGLIVPGVNTNCEPEFYRMAPAGVSVHTSRMMLLGQATQESYHRMEKDTSRAAAELATAEVDVIAWGCTSGGVFCPPAKIETQIQSVAGCPAISTISSAIAGLKAVGAKRIALGTPYVDFINETEIDVFRKSGLEVVSCYGLRIGESQHERRGIGRVPPESMHRFTRFVDHPKADAIFISCTNLAGVEELELCERECGKPVLTSTQATFWHCLRTGGIREHIEGFGTLLAEH